MDLVENKMTEGSSLQNKPRTSNYGLSMGFIWVIGLGKYKSTHVDKDFNFFISVNLLMLVTSVSHRPCMVVLEHYVKVYKYPLLRYFLIQPKAKT